MLPYLHKDSLFPPTDTALKEPNGLLAAGGDLSAERLVDAYSKGIFPWYSEDEPILWWSPDPRTVFFVDTFKPSKSLVRFFKQSDLRVTLNHDFAQTVSACAEPRIEQSGTWITEDIINAYIKLHQLGLAHSVEVWQKDQLVGGIYGVSIGKLFCGESMFSRISNGSKLALSCLIGYLKQSNFPLIDCQVANPHLASLGAESLSRRDYLEFVCSASAQKNPQTIWYPKELNAFELLSRAPVSRNKI